MNFSIHFFFIFSEREDGEQNGISVAGGGKTNLHLIYFLPFSFIASFLIQMKYNMPITISH